MLKLLVRELLVIANFLQRQERTIRSLLPHPGLSSWMDTAIHTLDTTFIASTFSSPAIIKINNSYVTTRLTMALASTPPLKSRAWLSRTRLQATCCTRVLSNCPANSPPPLRACCSRVLIRCWGQVDRARSPALQQRCNTKM